MAKELSDKEKFVVEQHKEYIKYIDIWRKCRIVFEGEESVKDNASLFVPALRDQNDNDYIAYVKRGLFYEASGRTLLGLVAALLGRQPNLIPPSETDKKYFEELVIDGQPFERFLHYACRELLALGRIGILVDVMGENGAAYAVSYVAENILNWRVGFVEGKPKLYAVVLSEGVHYRRVLELDEYGFYRQGFWENENKEVKVADDFNWVEKEVIYPKMQGVSLEYIPFFIGGLTSYAYEVVRPPLLGLVNANIAHFRNSVDYEHGLHFTGLPTPWVAGFDNPEGSTLYIGSEAAWISDSPDAKAGFLEFTGKGLDAIRQALQDKEGLMAILGARLLSMPKNMAESAEAKRLDMLGEQSILALVAAMLSDLTTDVLRLREEWNRKPGFENIQIEIKKDFTAMSADPQLLNQLILMLQGGLISYKTFFFNLKKMSLVLDGTTEEDELEELKNLPLPGLDLEPTETTEQNPVETETENAAS